jgi:branched-chain amino acid transport system substrate-binding protein
VKRRSFLSSAAAAAAAAAAPGAARAQLLNPQYQQQRTIAVNVPLSGDRSGAGREILYGVQAAIDETNRYGGTFGSAFVVRTFDDMDALAQSMLNVQFAAADATVVATIGGFDASLVTASLQTYANEQMPLLVPGSTADAVTGRGYRNVWRLPTKDSLEGQLYARFIERRAKPKLAVAVTQDGDYGTDVAQGFLNQARSSRFVADIYTMPLNKTDFAGAAKNILQAKPDLVYLCGQTGDMGPLIPALQQAGYKGKFGASQGFYNAATAEKYGDAFSSGFISTSFPPLERAPDVANALNDFRQRYAVTALSAFAYAAAQIVIAAVRRVGATNRLATLSALQSPTTYNTLVGSFQFVPTGDPVDPELYFYTVQDGKFRFAAASHPSQFIL